MKPRYEEVGVFSEDYAAVKLDERWGYIHKKRGIAIAPRFKSAQRFHNGLAAVERNGKWGYVNKQGNMAIDFQFEWNADMEFN